MKKSLFASLALVGLLARADIPNTNQVSMDYITSRLVERLETSTNQGVFPEFLAGSRNRFEYIVYDRLVPFRSGSLWDSTAERTDRAMKNAGLRSFEYAGRDFAEGLEIWNRMDNYWGDFLSQSIGSVDEELIDPLDHRFRRPSTLSGLISGRVVIFASPYDP